MVRTLRPELLDELPTDCERPEDLLGGEGLFKQLKKALLARALGAELPDHLGYEKGGPAGRGTDNSRNGHSGKTVVTEDRRHARLRLNPITGNRSRSETTASSQHITILTCTPAASPMAVGGRIW